ncbi:hypothetical protein ACTXT7_007747 [Hymenolepis weldensis]
MSKPGFQELRDPSHFSTVKLAEVGLANLHRLDIWWKTINDQLLSLVNPHLSDEFSDLKISAVAHD